MKKFIKNVRGITLIELLISISILSIVLISFFAFFTNTFRFNSLNSDDIQAMNLAREEKELIKTDPFIHNWSLHPSGDYYRKNSSYNGTDFDIIISIQHVPVSTAEFPMYLVHIEVQKANKFISETYTYYEPGP
jgi:prepilin-type N-terminal cleavage/methylation domain-containing protein